jgi:hypothetical protein
MTAEDSMKGALRKIIILAATVVVCGALAAWGLLHVTGVL